MEVKNYSDAARDDFEGFIKTKIINESTKLSENDIITLTYEEGKKKNLSINECKKLGLKIYNDMYKLGILQQYIEDESINEIMVNGLNNILVERNGEIEETTDFFSDFESINIIIQKIVSRVNRRVNASSPIVDARLEDGSRVNIVLSPIALNGPIITIRKFKTKNLTLDDYVELDIIDDEIKNFLIYLVENKYNIFVSGGTSSGKTTFLNAISEYIPFNERVITIEDSAELKLTSINNLVTLETKTASITGIGEVTMEDLVKCSLRMRPDRIIVGEVRGKEALEMINAMNTGHDGSLSTGHSNSSLDMLNRLEIMVLRNIDIPLIAVKKMIASSIDILIHLERSMSGKRYIKNISELSFKEDYILYDLYKLKNNKLIKINDFSYKKKV